MKAKYSVEQISVLKNNVARLNFPRGVGRNRSVCVCICVRARALMTGEPIIFYNFALPSVHPVLPCYYVASLERLRGNQPLSS